MHLRFWRRLAGILLAACSANGIAAPAPATPATAVATPARATAPPATWVRDLARPDALIRTRSLSRLPRDLVKVPVLKDVLTEDFVFFYEQHEDRLGLKGSIRRIAYEHDLQWTDRLLNIALDEPAEVAFWRGKDGALQYWMLAGTRNQLTRLLEQVAKVALDDSQLRPGATLDVDGQEVPTYTFAYSPRRTLLFASHGGRLVILSDPQLLQESDDAAATSPAKVVAQLLGVNKARHGVLRESFRLPEDFDTHSVAVGSHFLSFGYQHFFPGMQALRFDFSKAGWSSQVLIDSARLPDAVLDGSALWAATPINASACSLLPMDWSSLPAVVSDRKPEVRRAAQKLAGELQGPAAICWYGDAHLRTPLLVATLKGDISSDVQKAASQVFAYAVRGKAQQNPLDIAAPAGDSKLAMLGSLFRGFKQKIVQTFKGGEIIWQNRVTSGQGVLKPAKDSPAVFDVTLAARGRHLLFSPDAKLVNQALATLRKQYPALADQLPAGRTLGLLAPAPLATLLSNETFASLPARHEAVFRNAAKTQLQPRLDALKKHPPYRFALGAPATAGSGGWRRLEWTALKRGR